MSLFLSCGEVSGDQYAGGLLEALREAGGDLPVWGMGGEACGGRGMEILWPLGSLQLMGVVEVLAHLPRLFRLREEMAREVLRRSPRGVVLVDSPDFHLPLARRLRALGYAGPVVNLVPPTVWAWRSGRVRTLRRCMTLCLPLFPFEHAYLEARGCASAFLGHPLLDEILPRPTAPEDRRRVAFLPGSRGSEVRRLLPPFLETARILADRGYLPRFSVAPGLSGSLRERMTEAIRGGGFEVSPLSGREVMASSACVVEASGTATLEALLLRRPLVAAYAAHPLSMALARGLVRVPYCALPNLLAGEAVFPEFLQEQVRPDRLVPAALSFLEASPAERLALAERMEGLCGLLGEGPVYPFWARKVGEAMAA